MQEKNRRTSFLKLIRITYLVIGGLILTAGLSVYFFMHDYISKVNMVSPDEKTAEVLPYVDTGGDTVQLADNALEKENAQDRDSTYAASNSAFIPYSYYSAYIGPYLQSGGSGRTDSAGIVTEQNEIDTLKEKIKQNYEAGDIIDDGGQENILILGCESGNMDLEEDSMAMVMITMDHEKKVVTATAFQQDIYLQIPGEGNHRLGDAYELGGAELLTAALEKNFKLKIDRYMKVDVLVFIDLIDAIGGITLEVTQKDLDAVNSYIRELNTEVGEEADADILKKTGKRHLNGKQALAYSWNRNLLEGDFENTERQNKVMEAVRTQIYSYDLTKLHGLFDLILPKITTNLTESELIALLLCIPSYPDYKLREVKIPVEGSYQNMLIDKKVVLGIDFEENVKELRDKLASAK